MVRMLTFKCFNPNNNRTRYWLGVKWRNQHGFEKYYIYHQSTENFYYIVHSKVSSVVDDIIDSELELSTLEEAITVCNLHSQKGRWKGC